MDEYDARLIVTLKADNPRADCLESTRKPRSMPICPRDWWWTRGDSQSRDYPSCIRIRWTTSIENPIDHWPEAQKSCERIRVWIRSTNVWCLARRMSWNQPSTLPNHIQRTRRGHLGEFISIRYKCQPERRETLQPKPTHLDPLWQIPQHQGYVERRRDNKISFPGRVARGPSILSRSLWDTPRRLPWRMSEHDPFTQPTGHGQPIITAQTAHVSAGRRARTR